MAIGTAHGTHEARARGALALVPDGVHLIGGDWSAAASGETIEVVDPASGDVLRRVPRGGADDVAEAVSAAAAAFPRWRDNEPHGAGRADPPLG